jgi:hypothetical protein
MPPPELVKLHDAAGRLAVEWNIPSEVAMQIIRGVLRSGECFVRGRRLYDMMGLRDISKEISGEFGSTFSPAFLFSREFVDAEIDWNDLLKHGRKLVPGEWEYRVSAAEDAEVGPYGTLKSDDERNAVDLLAERLRADPNMKRDDAWAICHTAFPKLSERVFRNHVWRHARVAARLEPTAPPGPKPKNLRPKQNRRA